MTKPPRGGRLKRTAQTNPEGLQQAMGWILDGLGAAGESPLSDVPEALRKAEQEGRLIKRKDGSYTIGGPSKEAKP